MKPFGGIIATLGSTSLGAVLGDYEAGFRD